MTHRTVPSRSPSPSMVVHANSWKFYSLRLAFVPFLVWIHHFISKRRMNPLRFHSLLQKGCEEENTGPVFYYLSSLHDLLRLCIEVEISPQGFEQHLFFYPHSLAVDAGKLLDAAKHTIKVLVCSLQLIPTPANPTTSWVVQCAQGPASPEAPPIYGAGKDHVSLVRGEVEVGVIGLLQPCTPVINLISARRLALTPFLLFLFLRSLLKHSGGEQSSCHCIHLQERTHPQ